MTRSWHRRRSPSTRRASTSRHKVRVYLYIFNNRDAFERLRATIDDCARNFVTDPETYELLEQSPFVIVGQGPWGPKFKAALRAGLEVAAGTGG